MGVYIHELFNKNKMKKIIITPLLIIFTMLFSNSLHAQKEILSENLLIKNWYLIEESDGIKIYVKKDLCKVGPQEKALKYLFYKIENTTSTNKNIYFSPVLRFNSNPTDNEQITQYNSTEENKKSVFVSKNSSEECDCSFSNGTLSSLITNPNYPDVREFKAIKLLDIKID